MDFVARAARSAMTIARTGQFERTTQAEFEAFYLLTARTLHGYLCRIAGDPATADEVLQETYIRMLNAPPMGELPRKAYLYKTATNLLRDRWRKQKREQKLWEMNEFTGHVHQPPVHRLAEDLLRLRVVDRHRNHLDAHRVQVLGHVERRLVRLLLGLDAQHCNPAEALDQIADGFLGLQTMRR